MKSQNFRPYKPNGSGPSGSSVNGGNNGHRRSNSRFSGQHKDSDSGPASSLDADSVNDSFIDLLAKSLGKLAIATVSSGARYQGLLQAADLTASGTGSVSIVLYKPTMVSKALLDEKSNSDGSLPEKLIIPAKDLIDFDVIVPSSAPKPEKVDDNKSQEKLNPLAKPLKESLPAPYPEKSFAKVAAEAAPEKVKQKSPTPPTQASAASEKSKVPSQPKTKPPPEKPRTQERRERSASPSKSPSKSHFKQAPYSAKESPRFKTDKDISSSFQFREKELQPWVPDDDSPALTLEESTGTGSTWDQFKVNEEKFGVESSYDEHLYTTKINTDAKDFKERVRRAERLAREIEGQSTTDRHVLEERGVLVDDSGLDEEDKYSGVINDRTDQRGNELMAALKNASISSESRSSADNTTESKPGAYTTPRQNAAHYHNDPAIISSSASRGINTPSSLREKTPQQQTSVDPSDTEPTEESSTSANAKPKSIPPKPPVAPANKELFRLNAQSEINALREFSANFRVPHKMPNDLLPILAKDKLKQDEILKRADPSKKAAAAAAAASASGATPGDGVGVSAASSSGTTTSSPNVAPDAKKDSSKSSFKLNPKAAVFTPSQKLTDVSPNAPKAYFASPNNPSPRIRNQRPHNFSDRSNTGKRHHKVSAAEFFGSSDKIPTAEGQKEKIARFRTSFNMFNTARRKHAEQEKEKENNGEAVAPLVLEKAFHTPPTWDSTVEENYEKVLMQQCSPTLKSTPMMMPHPMMPMFPAPVVGMAGASPQMAAAGGFPAAPNAKFPMSPIMQGQQPNMAAAAQFQQLQQLQAAAMMYQFQGGAPPGAPQMMYTPPGVDGQFFPPGGFVVPGGFVNPGSPQGGHMMMGGSPYLGQGPPAGAYKGHPYQGNRRFNNNHAGKRGNNN